uniref:Uncharacterized protein n=1 Tax=Aegilops tauschii subsp. strangulata TaxID=200361 RepID=A0A453GKS7_AEGTS
MLSVKFNLALTPSNFSRNYQELSKMTACIQDQHCAFWWVHMRM